MLLRPFCDSKWEVLLLGAAVEEVGCRGVQFGQAQNGDPLSCDAEGGGAGSPAPAASGAGVAVTEDAPMVVDGAAGDVELEEADRNSDGNDAAEATDRWVLSIVMARFLSW